MNREMNEMLNGQIALEFYSAYLYLDISNYYTSQNLAGFAHWFRVQTMEERDHALLIVDYLHAEDEIVSLQPIPAPSTMYTAAKDPLLSSYEHERSVTNSIHELYDLALTAKDYRTLQFLDWFVKEQGEEEKNARELCDKFDLFGTDAKSLYLLDSELAARTYAPPSTTA